MVEGALEPGDLALARDQCEAARDLAGVEVAALQVGVDAGQALAREADVFGALWKGLDRKGLLEGTPS